MRPSFVRISAPRVAAAVCAVLLAAVAAFLGLPGNARAASTAVPGAAGITAAPAAAATAANRQAFLTFYGWYDNTPPGGDISYPELHDTAGGTGTYADPITFATSTAEAPAGTRIWVPRVGKYFIMEDSCEECGADWSGKGPNGGPNLYHFDLWLGGAGGNAFDAIDCEDALTHYNTDGTPTLEPVVVDPPSNEPYDPTPVFNTGTGACYGGAQADSTVGTYTNVSTAQCLENPGNSSASGTKLATAACTGGASQKFTFHGAFLISNSLCATLSGSSIKLAACDGGPNQQWSVNPNLTISDIQTGKKCFRAAGGTLTAGSCSGAASQWNFTDGSTVPPTSPPPTTPPPSTPPPSTPPPTSPPAGGNRSYEAEAATLAGGTTVTSCAHCSGGKKLSYLGNGGTATFTGISEPAAGAYTLTVYFMSVGQARTAVVTVNGTPQTVSFPETPDYNTVVAKTVTVQLKAGTANTIQFSNPTTGAPNLDRITV